MGRRQNQRLVSGIAYARIGWHAGRRRNSVCESYINNLLVLQKRARAYFIQNRLEVMLSLF